MASASAGASGSAFCANVCTSFCRSSGESSVSSPSGRSGSAAAAVMRLRRWDASRSIAAAVERRASLVLGSQGVVLEQQILLLRALSRLHLSLELGQSLDWRQLASYVLPVVRSVNVRDECPTR